MKTALLNTLPLAVAILGLNAVLCSAQEFPKPGPEHEMLKKLAGEFSVEMTCHMTPNAPETVQGEYTAKLDFGGFFLSSDYKGTMMGQPFHGHGVTGYDPQKKQYTGTWVDSMGPYFYSITGSFNDAETVYTEVMNGPGPDGQPMTFTSTTEITDKNHLKVTMSTKGEDGQETVMMEGVYTRK